MIDPGLCLRCQFSRQIQSSKGSVFWLCRVHDVRPDWPKYPPLPVRRCEEFRAVDEQR